MKTLILLLLLSTSVFGQKEMVLIENYPINVEIGDHEIKVQDSLIYETVKRYEHYMETNPINYEKGIRKVERICMIQRDRYWVSEFKEGTLYLNSRLNKLPASKEVVIIQNLANINGMRLKRGDNAHVDYKFNITPENEDLFRKQLVRHGPYKYVVEKLSKQSPLRSKR